MSPYTDDHALFLDLYGKAWSSGDDQLLRDTLSDDADYIEAGMGVDYIGTERVLGLFRFMLKFSADSLIEFTEFNHNDDSFVAEWTWSGTADGPLRLGDKLLPATGRPYSVKGVALCKVNDEGKVTYHKDIYDVLVLLKQLGYDG